MKIRIESLGDGSTTHVYNDETGEEIQDIVSVTWKVRAGEFSAVLLEFAQPKVKLIGELRQWMKT